MTTRSILGMQLFRVMFIIVPIFNPVSGSHNLIEDNKAIQTLNALLEREFNGDGQDEKGTRDHPIGDERRKTDEWSEYELYNQLADFQRSSQLRDSNSRKRGWWFSRRSRRSPTTAHHKVKMSSFSCSFCETSKLEKGG